MYGIEQRARFCHVSYEEQVFVPSSLEDRILQLCVQLAEAADNEAEVERLIPGKPAHF